MRLIWLRQQNPYHDDYCKTNFKYVPDRCSTDTFCHCGLSKTSMKEKCEIFLSDIMKQITLSVKNQTVCKSLKAARKKF